MCDLIFPLASILSEDSDIIILNDQEESEEMNCSVFGTLDCFNNCSFIWYTVLKRFCVPVCV